MILKNMLKVYKMYIYSQCNKCGYKFYGDDNANHICIDNVTLNVVPITTGDSNGVQFLCSSCDFPKNDTLTLNMKYCWNCGIKIDWSQYENSWSMTPN